MRGPGPLWAEAWEGVCGRETQAGAERAAGGERSSFRGVDALAWAELVGYGSGRSVTTGLDSHPESVSEQLGLEPAHLGLIRRFM